MALRHVVEHSNEDGQIEHAVRAELRMSLSSSGRQFVGVAVEHGVVSLTGFVDNYAQKWALERAAARIAGVKGVRNHLDVLPPQDPSREDHRIHGAATCALKWDARVPSTVYSDVTDGVLRLRGGVERFSQREAAEEAVRNLVGVRDVVNEIKVALVPDREDLDRDVEAAIRRRYSRDGERIHIATTAGVVILSGVVPSFAMLEDIERTVWSVPGVVRIDNQLLVA